MKKITLLIAFFFGIIATGSAQFLENFDASTTIPAGWSVINQGGANTWNIGAPQGFPAPPAISGTKVARISYNATAHDDYLITPQITPTAGVSDRLTFWAKNYGPTYHEHYEVLISTTDASASANFSTVLQPDTAAPDAWGKSIIDLTPYNGQPIYIAFRAVSANQFYLCFDDIANDTTPAGPPNCDAALTSPLDGATNTAVTGLLTWSGATGDPTGYNLKVGTTPGGSNVLATTDVGNVTSYNVGSLLYSTTYYVSIVPYSTNGTATGCTENSFTTKAAPGPGNLCENPIVVTLPYTTSDDTTNYEDLNYEGSPGASGCGSTYNYLNGNDVVYAYTATSDTSINVKLTTTGTYVGLFAYTSCSAIGTGCVAGAVNGFAGGPINLLEFPVVTGTTYYFVISTWADPQTAPYTLNIVENTCTNATATFTVVSDCLVGPQFYVDVNITDLGTATSLTVSDDQSSPTQNVSATGIVVFGPYPNATPVIFTITNDQDANCVVTSPAKTQASCPPANDDIAAPTELILDLGTACGANQLTLQSITSTTASPEVTPTCAFSTTGVSGDVWYKIVAPNPDFTLNTSNVTGPNFFTASGELYSGAPGSLTAVGANCGNTWPKNYTGLTVGNTYYLRIWDFNNDGTGTFSLCGYYLDCVNATATYAIVSDCVNAPQFFIDVNVTNLGSATSLTISNNGGAPSQNVSNTGIVNFGPFANNTPVIFTIANDQNAVCTITSPPQNQVACPGPNDDCSGAIDLIVGTDFNSGKIVTNNLAATTSPELPFPTAGTGGCGGLNFATTAKDIWYTVTVPASGNFNVETKNGVGITDTAVQIYSGNCASFVPVTCNDDTPLNNFSLATVTGRTPGEILYVRVFGYNGASGTFDLSAYDASLATSSFDTNGFSSYPNPVTDILNLSYSKNIDKVQVMNLLGQEVQTKAINATNAKVDMSNLASGTYLVKVTSDNQVKTLKVVKN